MRKRGGKRGSERNRESDRERVCVCVKFRLEGRAREGAGVGCRVERERVQGAGCRVWGGDRGMMRVFLLSRAAFPASSRISAVKYSITCFGATSYGASVVKSIDLGG